MSYKPVQHSVLLKTSAATDVQYSNRKFSIAGFNFPINALSITSIVQYKSRPEVSQVQTIGASLYTPTPSTRYTVQINDPRRRVYGASQSVIPFSFVTPPVITTLGATAALQREAINAALVTAINNATNTIFATAASLTLGAGFTITDSAGYYGPNGPRTAGGPNELGPNSIYLAKNPDGTGFIDSTDRVVTTTGVYSFGIGTTLVADKAVLDPMFGNIISGTTGSIGFQIACPVASDGSGAVAGQLYDAFLISSLVVSAIPNATSVQGYNIQQDAIFYDNGTGTSTTNLAGAVAFEREMLRIVAFNYSNSPITIGEFFEQPGIFASTTTGVAPVGTTQVGVAYATGENELVFAPIGTATVVAPIVTASGCPLTLDATDEEGMELGVSQLTQCPKEFVVGKQAVSYYARINLGAVIADIEEFAFGFRKKAAYAVDVAAYVTATTDVAFLGWVDADATKGLYQMETSLAGAVLTKTSTAITGTNSTAIDLMVTCDINGNVKFYINGVDKTPLITTAPTLTTGAHMVPFIITINGAGVGTVPVILQELLLPTNAWRV